jgi:uncharacterized protein
MLHPHTELRFVSQDIGYGIFATSFIPKGTMTWVKDELDRVIPKDEVSKLSPANIENLMKYTYRDPKGDYIFCWDLTRYVNHSYTPNSMLTTLGFEIAIRDIHPGEELTNDYGTLNIIMPFKCASHPDHTRENVCPDDLARFHPKWDEEIQTAFTYINKVAQPLDKFLTPSQKDELTLINRGEAPIPSVLSNLYRP